MEFADYEISTVTLTAKIVNLITGGAITHVDIKKLAESLIIDDFVKLIKSNKKKSSSNKKAFSNCCSIKVLLHPHLSHKPANVKIFSNGGIQIAGLRNLDDISYLNTRLTTLLGQLKTNNIFDPPQQVDIAVISSDICGIMASIKTLNNTIIDQVKLYNMIYKMSDESLSCVFKNTTKQLQIFKKFDTWETLYIIFTTGHIKIYRTKNVDQLVTSVEFIKEFISNNYDDIAMTDSNGKMVKIVSAPTQYEQLTPQWFNVRKKYITASEAQYLMLQTPKYGSRNEYIKKKIISMNYPQPRRQTPAMTHGIIMEPIAKRIVEHVYNTDTTKMCYIKIFDAGFHTRGNLGASPDGIVFKFKKPKGRISPNISKITPKNIKQQNNHKLIDTCLIEIKCPVNFRTVKDLKTEYPNYYCQIQTQLYVMDVEYCMFSNNKFIQYSSKSEWKKNLKTFKYGGMLFDITRSNKRSFVYPKNIFTKSVGKTIISDIISQQCEKIHQIIYWGWRDGQLLMINRDRKWFNDKLYHINIGYEEIMKRQDEMVFTEDTTPEEPGDYDD